MTLLLHVNEASASQVASRQIADQVASQFASVVLDMKRRRGDAALVFSAPLAAVELCHNYMLGEWGNHPLNKDRWRAIRALQNRSPGWHREKNDDASEYWFNDERVLALGDAHMSDGLLVSFATNVTWEDEWLTGIRRYLLEEASGDAQVVEVEVRVRNASTEAHLIGHADWVSLRGVGDIESGDDLASCVGELFTSLRFLPAALEHLRSLDPKWVAPVAQQLALLNRALAEWSADAAHPAWYTHVTPDSQSRRDEGILDFVDFDGTLRTFDLHARFTPGAGRIHFRLVAVDRSATIAHVGRKIE